MLLPTGNRRRQYIIIFLVLFLLFTVFLARPTGRYIYGSQPIVGQKAEPLSDLIKDNPFPPKYERLIEWERNLPQHNLDLPFPEGRTGRYVKFTNQIKMLGWNNVLNEV